jgi:hypothetical protein
MKLPDKRQAALISGSQHTGIHSNIPRATTKDDGDQLVTT